MKCQLSNLEELMQARNDYGEAFKRIYEQFLDQINEIIDNPLDLLFDQKKYFEKHGNEYWLILKHFKNNPVIIFRNITSSSIEKDIKEIKKNFEAGVYNDKIIEYINSDRYKEVVEYMSKIGKKGLKTVQKNKKKKVFLINDRIKKSFEVGNWHNKYFDLFSDCGLFLLENHYIKSIVDFNTKFFNASPNYFRSNICKKHNPSCKRIKCFIDNLNNLYNKNNDERILYYIDEAKKLYDCRYNDENLHFQYNEEQNEKELKNNNFNKNSYCTMPTKLEKLKISFDVRGYDNEYVKFISDSALFLAENQYITSVLEFNKKYCNGSSSYFNTLVNKMTEPSLDKLNHLVEQLALLYNSTKDERLIEYIIKGKKLYDKKYGTVFNAYSNEKELKTEPIIETIKPQTSLFKKIFGEK